MKNNGDKIPLDFYFFGLNGLNGNEYELYKNRVDLKSKQNLCDGRCDRDKFQA
jgi:hypothetical protein